MSNCRNHLKILQNEWIQREFYKLPNSHPQLGGEHPLPRLHPLGAFGASFLGAFGTSYSMPLNYNPVSAPGGNTSGRQDSETFSFFTARTTAASEKETFSIFYIFRYRPRNIGDDAVVLGSHRAEIVVNYVGFATVGGNQFFWLSCECAKSYTVRKRFSYVFIKLTGIVGIYDFFFILYLKYFLHVSIVRFSLSVSSCYVLVIRIQTKLSP